MKIEYCPECHMLSSSNGCYRLKQMRAWQCKTYQRVVTDLTVAMRRL